MLAPIAQPEAYAAPYKRFKVERDERGQKVGITMPGQVTVRAGGQIVMHAMGNPGTLTRLGAYRLRGATPLGGGKFAVEADVAPNTPLSRMVKLMSKRSGNPVAASQAGTATERFSAGQPSGGVGRVDFTMHVMTGTAVIENEYAKKVFLTPNAPSYQAWANTPRR